MAHPPSPFEAMPLELHIDVLSHMATPEDVHATIRASPAAWSAFGTSRERIYAAVLETALAPETFRELLAIVNAPDHNTCSSFIPAHVHDEADGADEALGLLVTEWNSWNQKAVDFIRSHASGAVYKAPDPKTDITEFNAQIKFMIRLYFCLSKFVRFYPTFVRDNAARTPPTFPQSTTRFGQQAQGDHQLPRFNDTELLRLQRGLLRYELCCRLNGIPSTVASCNMEAIYGGTGNDVRGLALSRLWFSFGLPLSETLPIDELEEIICAKVYVMGLYDNFRWSFAEEFHNHILHLTQGRGEGVLDKDSSKTSKMTAGDWLLQSESSILQFDSSKRFSAFDWPERMARLGLVFLERMTRASIADRRDFLRTDFSAFLVWNHHVFLQTSWHHFAYGLLADEEESLMGVGPRCNPIIKACSSNYSLANLVGSADIQPHLRNLGWVFFDDKSNLASLGLPHEAQSYSIRGWVRQTEKRMGSWPDLVPKVPESALDTLFTEQDWNQLVMEKYSPKDHGGNHQAMYRFIAGVRAVVDFKSNQLPHID